MDWLDKFEKARLTQTKDFTIDSIPTSYTQLDEILGVGGIPRGKIIEIAGAPGVGKSALILDIITKAQEKELNVAYFDLDRGFSKEFAILRDVKCDDLLIFRPPENKSIPAALNKMIAMNLVDVVVFDSISQLGEDIPFVLQELAKDIVGTKVTVILASQLRHNFDDPRDYKTPFMPTLNQYCNVRIMLKKVESIKHGEILIGRKLDINVYKNDLFYPKTCEIELYF